MEIKTKEQLKIVLVGLAVFFIGLFLDNKLASFLNLLRSPLDSLFVFITIAFSKYVVLAVVGVMLFRKRQVFVSWIASFFVNYSIAYALKIIVARPRPFQLLEFDNLARATGFSFPSGHAIIYFAAYPFLAEVFPRHKKLILVILSTLALLRVYLNVHYLSDIAASLIISMPISYLLVNLANKFPSKKEYITIARNKKQ